MKRETFIYFIQSGDGGPIKIGIAVDVEERREGLQCGNPVRLHIVGVVVGDWHLEQSLQARFAEGRIHGEWFRPDTPGLADLLAYVFEHSALPPMAYGDPMLRGCPMCGWQMEDELIEHGEESCWRCITHPLQSKIPASPDLDEGAGAHD